MTKASRTLYDAIKQPSVPDAAVNQGNGHLIVSSITIHVVWIIVPSARAMHRSLASGLVIVRNPCVFGALSGWNTRSIHKRHLDWINP